MDMDTMKTMTVDEFWDWVVDECAAAHYAEIDFDE